MDHLCGSIFGIFPQCGFAAFATNFYAARVITLGTLIAVYLSTSDEMIPILISKAVPVMTIIKILGIKFLLGMIYGFLIDFVLRLKNKNKQEEQKIVDLCEEEHCHCEENNIFKSALKHTLNIFIYIFVLTLFVNIIVSIIGQDRIGEFIRGKTIFEPIISSLIGLIPNCASSVIITEFYVSGIISLGSLIAGLLVNSGTGLLMLFRINKNLKENISIVTVLYVLGAISRNFDKFNWNKFLKKCRVHSLHFLKIIIQIPIYIFDTNTSIYRN